MVVDDVVSVESELSWHVVGSEIVSLINPKMWTQILFMNHFTLDH